MAVLLESPLFEGFTQDDLLTMLGCFNAKIHTYKRGEVIFTVGQKVQKVGVILTGHVDTVQEDYWGNAFLLGRFRPGQVFADSFVLAGADALPFSAISVARTAVLFLDYPQVVMPCGDTCPCHTRLITNLLSISAKKNIFLLTKLNHVTKHSVREKILTYLSWESKKAGKNEFSIQYNRQGLANYLDMDRSTLSSELAKLQKEGILSYDRNTFALHRPWEQE